jgi:hypothetical protein
MAGDDNFVARSFGLDEIVACAGSEPGGKLRSPDGETRRPQASVTFIGIKK